MSGTIVRAPEVFINSKNKPSVFLAGSIDMGKAEDWQPKFEKELVDLDVVIYNPRRLDFDTNQEYSETNPYLSKQVKWELEHLLLADVVVIYFDPSGKAPISLFEMGLISKAVQEGEKKGIILCPDGYWKKANVILNANFFNFEIAETFEDFISKTKIALGEDKTIDKLKSLGQI